MPALQLGQWEGGLTIDSLFGSLTIQTFRKLPNTLPKTKATSDNNKCETDSMEWKLSVNNPSAMVMMISGAILLVHLILPFKYRDDGVEPRDLAFSNVYLTQASGIRRLDLDVNLIRLDLE